MLLLPSPRCGRRRRASLLLPLLSAVLLCVIPVSASLPAHIGCPDPSLCDKQGRKPCKPGSFRCGPCLSPWQENKKGHCEPMKHQHYDEVKSYNLDEEIDYLHSVIEKQEQVLEMKQETAKKQPKHPVTITSQTDRKNSKMDASKIKQKNQDRLLNDTPTVAPPSNTPTPQPRTTGVEGKAGPIYRPGLMTDTVIIIIISMCVAVGIVSVILATVCFIKFQKESRLADKVDYPAFGGASVPTSSAVMGDKTLAQSAQMFHYQHQKQQMLSMGNHKPEQKVSETEGTSDEEEVGGDFTVYECPGLAPTGEMEVKNPLFDDSAIPYQGNAK